MTGVAEGSAQETEVAIVGAGPVGALLGNFLGLCGVRTVILEREGSIYNLPRAIHFDDEIMRQLQTVGLADEMRGRVHVSPGMLFLDANGRLLLDWSRPQTLTPQGWNASYRFHQPELERVLRDGLKRFPSVTLAPRCDVFAIDERPHGATLGYEEIETGALKTLKARYVVGCDGARSLVRRLIGEPMEELGFCERWLVVDVVLKRPRPDLGDYSLQHCRPGRAATYVRGTGDRRRWEIALADGEDGSAATQPARVFEHLREWVDPEDAELERAAVYTFRSAVARAWRRGPLLIAGDAAHLTPPFLGQGMCAGMRDAGNLAWKLARVLAGQSPASLLDSYGPERAPHVREYIELAVRLGGLINAKAMEAAVPRATLEGGEPVRMQSLKPRLGGLEAQAEPAGRLAPQPRLGDGTLLDARVGLRFAALMRPDFAAALGQQTRRQLEAEGVAVVAEDAPELQQWLNSVEAVAVAVRPDRYILGAARDEAMFRSLMSAI